MFGKLWLGVRSVAMTVLSPGTVAGYLPYRIVAQRSQLAPTNPFVKTN